MSSDSEDYFLILNLTDKSSENVTSKDDTIMVGKIHHRFSENSSYSFKLSVREDFVNTRSTKFERLFITGIKDTIDRITAIKIIESLNSFYFSKIVQKDPQKEKVRELLKKGKTVDVDDDIILFDKNLTRLPLKFGKVSGDFYCNDNQLTTLEGCPTEVGRDFN